MSKRTHIERDIDAPAERVWALLTDAAGYTSWNPTTISLNGSIAQGETISLVTTVDPKRTFKLKVAELSPPHRMVWSDGMPLGLFRGTRTYLVSERGDGCRFTMTEEFTGPLAPLITKAIPDLTDSFVQIADGLKTAAETQ